MNSAYTPSLNNGSYGTYLYPKIDDSLRLQRKWRKIKQSQPHRASISNGSYGTFLFPIQQRVISNPWNALPSNARTTKHAKNTEQLLLKKRKINEIAPDSFKSFRNLRELYLNYNFLTNSLKHSTTTSLYNLSKPLFRLSLLDLSFNLLTNIEGLQHLISLKHLNLSNNYLSLHSFDAMISILKKLQFLEYLDLRFNPLTLDHNLEQIESQIIGHLTETSPTLQTLNNRKVEIQNKAQETSSFQYRDGKSIAFNQTFDVLDSRESSYDAGALTGILFSKSMRITKCRDLQRKNYLKKCYSMPNRLRKKYAKNQDYKKPFMFVKPEDMQSRAKSEVFRVEMRREVIEFMKANNGGKKEMSAVDIAKYLENNEFSLRYKLSDESKMKILDRFYFDVTQSEMDQMVEQEMTNLAGKLNADGMEQSRDENLKSEKSAEIKQRIEEQKKAAVDGGKVENISHRDLLNLLTDMKEVKWIEKGEAVRKEAAGKLYQKSMEIYNDRKDMKIEEVTDKMKQEMFENYLKAQAVHLPDPAPKNRNASSTPNSRTSERTLTQEILNDVANSNQDFKQRDFIKSAYKIHWF